MWKVFPLSLLALANCGGSGTALVHATDAAAMAPADATLQPTEVRSGVAPDPLFDAQADADVPRVNLGPGTRWQPCGRLGSGGIRAAVATSDGATLVVGFGDGRVLRTTADYVPLLPALTHDEPIVALAVSFDGRWMAAAGTRRFSVWEVATGQKATGAHGDTGALRVALAVDGSVVAISGERRTTWRARSAPDVELGRAEAGVIAFRGRELVMATPRRLAALAPGPARSTVLPDVEHATFSPDGELLAAQVSGGGRGFRIPIWQVADGQRIWAGVYGAASDGLVWAGTDRLAELSRKRWVIRDVRDGAILEEGGSLWGDPYRLYLGGAVREITSFGQVSLLGHEPPGSPVVALAAGPARAPSEIGGSRDGRAIAVATGEAVVYWHRSDPAPRWHAGWEVPLVVDFSADGNSLAIAGDARGIVRATDGGVAFGLAPPHAGPMGPMTYFNNDLRFAPDGNSLVGGSVEGVFRYRRQADQLVKAGTFAARRPRAGVAISPNGLYVATVEAELFRVADLQQVWAAVDESARPSGGLLNVPTVAFSADGTRLLVSECAQGATLVAPATHARLLRVADGVELRRFGAEVGCRPSLSPDARWLVHGDSLVHLEGNVQQKLGVPAVVSTFLADGAIAAGDAQGILHLFCPQQPTP